MYKLAPFSDNYDMWIALAFCYLPIIPLMILAYISHKSKSKIKVRDLTTPHGIKWIPSDENVPFHKIAWFQFAIVWFVLGSIFFWLLLWPDYQDVWFIITEK